MQQPDAFEASFPHEAKIGFIGAGKVGTSLGRYLRGKGFSIAGYASRTLAHAQVAAQATDSAAFESAEDLVRESNVVVLSVSDGAIAEVWTQLAQGASFEGKIVCHCSGSLASDVFVGADSCDARVCSVHPLLAIPDASSHEALAGALFTLEGNGEAVRVWEGILDACGNRHRAISAESKATYHAAAVFASNLVVGLAQSSIDLLMRCGFEHEEAWGALSPLFLGNCTAVAQRGPADALTGPIERNDAATVKRHLSVLDGSHLDTYVALSQELVGIASCKHPNRDYSEINQALLKEGNEQ